MTMTADTPGKPGFRDINSPGFMIAAAIMVMMAPNGFNFLPFMLGAAAETYSLAPEQIETLALVELAGTSIAPRDAPVLISISCSDLSSERTATTPPHTLETLD